MYTVKAPSDNRRGFAVLKAHNVRSTLIGRSAYDDRSSPSDRSSPVPAAAGGKRFNIFLIIMGVLLIQACQPDLNVIEDMTRVDDSPLMSTFNMEIVYSSGGIVRMIMTAPRMDHYEYENPYIEMPDGVEVLFYDSLMNVTSSIMAEYAISYGDNELVEARNDVVVINELNERLNTEHLVWDQKKEMIFSEKFVKITREEEVLYGDGFESDERFNQWVIKNPRGTFTIDTERGE